MTILDEIVANKIEEIKTLKDVAAPLRCEQDFTQLFAPAPCLIAEVKAASPSEGVIAKDFNPVSVAQKYIAGGCNAMSVLTDHKYFGGSFEILKSIRAITDKPLLCKEFVIEEKQVRVARACGADLVLLIVKILTKKRLQELKDAIEALGMKALIEVQNEEELEIALAVDPELLLINNRNLSSFEVDMKTTENLLAGIPAYVKVIAASGIQQPDEIRNFPARVDGFLIGTALMRAANPTEFLQSCRSQK
ncbi:MAG TPA: indole-3-glycerol phosphate synthase TrpC [Alphaproteobacteria bacterium]|nr:indole-3-glycerol-phosphate synthase TrpC [Rhodospirillaceae bacterium]HRJ12410.1 indole-3-glycerol phosphate synthase TrpC [Alphaproteobacteria bacterium]